MNKLRLKELELVELKRLNGGMIILANSKIIKWVDKGLRVAGVYDFAEGVYQGLKKC